MTAGKKYEIYNTLEKDKLNVLIICMSVSFLNAAPAPIECIPTREKMDKPAQPSLKVT